MIYSIILSGGAGTRFWPLSRIHKPKQFLKIFAKKSLIEETLDRISSLVKSENIYLAANKLHIKKIKNYLKRYHIPQKNFFFEPQGKNTFAPIAFLSYQICSFDKDAIITVFPSDHYIKDKEKFLKTFKKAIDVAKDGYIVTLGIVPKRPETGYGYIKSKVKSQRSRVYYEVERFIEKPDLVRARRFLKSRSYYWNAGIFVFKAQVLLEELKRINPKIYKIITQMKNKNEIINFWPKLPSISIDYAIMEKTDKAAVLPLDCGWTDLGSWLALEDVMKKDKFGNILKGRCIYIKSKDNIVWSDKRLIVTLGLRNAIIVDTKDALLICSKDKVQDVRKVVQILKKRKLENLL